MPVALPITPADELIAATHLQAYHQEPQGERMGIFHAANEMGKELDTARARIAELERKATTFEYNLKTATNIARQRISEAKALKAQLSAAQEREEALLKLLASERGCRECWKGASCGRDCHMNDITALTPLPAEPQPGDVIGQVVYTGKGKPSPMAFPEPDPCDALANAAREYMAAFGQALEAWGISYGPQQQEADEKLRAALAALQEEVEG
jgi:hypothetical protein